jgi:predicted nucleic acid-binding Zn ribbon protein
MSAEPLKVCPECKGVLKRLIGTGAGPIFKGSGFYQTDYKNKQSGKSTTTSTNASIKDEKVKEKKPEKPKEDPSKK